MMSKKELSVFHNASTSFIHSASIYYYMIDTVPHVKDVIGGGFPGDPVVKTLSFHCKEAWVPSPRGRYWGCCEEQ